VTVYTVGHSTHPIDDFIALLRDHEIALVADVRRHPGSRRHPQFAREALAASLEAAGIAYRWMPGLGGRRRRRKDSPHTEWRSDSFAGYADHMDTPEFAAAVSELTEHAAAQQTTIMCAEAFPYHCHRHLIADWLVAHGVAVEHLLGPARREPHRFTAFARVDHGRVIYDKGQLPLTE